MKPIILCDVGLTRLDSFGTVNQPLIDRLQDYKKEGALIVMATDGSGGDALGYNATIRKHNKDIGLFDEIYSRSKFFCAKRDQAYWNKITEKFGENVKRLILIDDNSDILEQAKNNNIATVRSQFHNPTATIDELNSVYQTVSASLEL